MPSIRFRLEQPSLNGLADQVRREYGPDARILDTEESTVGGFGGFFGRRVIDVTVELPEEAVVQQSHEFDARRRVGIMALLEDADARDNVPGAAPGALPAAAAAPAVSTETGGFAAVLDALRGEVEGPRAAEPEPAAVSDAVTVRPVWIERRPAGRVPLDAPPPALRRVRTEIARPALREADVWAPPPGPMPRSRIERPVPGRPPSPRTNAGDLLLLAGLGDDAVGVAHAVRDRLRLGTVFDGGSVGGNTRRRVDDSRGALAARAQGVRSGQPVIVAYGLGDGDPAHPRFADFAGIAADQVWLVVDASRAAPEALAWTVPLRERVQVDALASIRAAGGRHGAPPAQIAALGLPEAWSDRHR